MESVAWISERKDVLSAFFFLLVLLSYTSYVKKRTILRNLAVFFLLMLGLMAKPMLVTVPFVLLLLDIWPLKRFDTSFPVAGYVGVTASPKNSFGSLRRLVIEKAPLFGLSAAASIITVIAQKKGHALSDAYQCAFPLRLENAAVAYVRYIFKTVWPSGLAVHYPHPGAGISPAAVAGSALFICCVTSVVVKLYQTKPYLFVGWMWFLGMLVPVIGIIQVGSQAIADRYMYLPGIGLMVSVVWGIYGAAHGNRRLERVLPIAGIVAVIVYAFLARHQTGYWKNSRILFEHTLSITDRNHLIHNNLGCFLDNLGEKKAALTHFREAVSIKPDYIEARVNLAGVLGDFGRSEEAVQLLRDTVRMAPGNVPALNCLGFELARNGRNDDAIHCFNEALRIDPAFAEAYNNRGMELERRGFLDDALAQYNEALRLKPLSVETLINIGNVLYKKDDFDASEECYRRALEVAPGNVMAHFNLGILFEARGQPDRALECYNQVISLDPGFPEAYNNLAAVLANQGKLYEAAAHLREALRLKPDYREARVNLEAVLTALGLRAAQ